MGRRIRLPTVSDAVAGINWAVVEEFLGVDRKVAEDTYERRRHEVSERDGEQVTANTEKKHTVE